MPKKTKTGKQRKDKFYQLAKESGYRARSAFKLIQLNRRFEFLQKSRVCVDLCAAPGGWMQVARQNMPVSSIVIGVDLFPIKPIPGCISLVEDITTDKCRIAITKELQTWKADVVLNDGAPNVGKNWIHDAYQQTVLSLAAFKLATQFLRPGGWFVTKVFRSKDYQAFQWVLKQLFKKVHSTKPSASRNESAEIFVICQYYIAPDKLDPKFFDPKYVFSELEIEPARKLNIHHPEKNKKAKAEGYPENDYTLHPILKVSEFIACEEPIKTLSTTSEVIFDDDKIKNHEKTTKEIIECCRDIKVLGGKDLRLLEKWHKALHTEFHGKSDVAEDENDDNIEDENKGLTEEEKEDKENAKIEAEIAELKAASAKEEKRKKKKVIKERQKLNERINLKMVHKGDEGPKLEEEDIFSMKQIKTYEQLSSVTDQNPDIVAHSDDDSDDERKPLPNKTKYEKEDGTYLDSSGRYYKSQDDPSDNSESEEESDSDKSGLGFSDDDEENKNDKKSSKKRKVTFDDESENPLITDLDVRDKKTKKIHKAELWYEKDSLKDIEMDIDADYELEKMAHIFKQKGGLIIGDNDKPNEVENAEPKQTKTTKKNKRQFNDDDSDYESDSDFDMDDLETSKKKNKKNTSSKDKDGFEIVSKEDTIKQSKKKRKLNEQDLALGSLLVQSQKSRRDITDAAWNRYAFNDDAGLPSWFIQDEEKHFRKEAPVSKEAEEEYKKRVEDLNARPIKKVLEAKGRQKRRAMKKLEKAKKKVESLMDNVDISDREKAKQVRAVYSKATKEPKKELTYVVANKSGAQKRVARPAGVQGRYKVVDPRMKKDLRAAKAKEKTKGRGKKTKGGKGGKPGKGRPMPKGKKAK
ncbi:hypothetical protein HCN44_005034 [Aphidius gifuensis]|uniref:Putative rRNA methyltransferase n=1 Tax=Aphidius gifuensis TaxID=684658 RepID=A0A835CTV1_APHGI|nr:hypothetical protein HCN44_005034 [Aphidius gifuensis]